MVLKKEGIQVQEILWFNYWKNFGEIEDSLMINRTIEKVDKSRYIHLWGLHLVITQNTMKYLEQEFQLLGDSSWIIDISVG